MANVLALDETIIKIRNMASDHEKLIVQLRDAEAVYEEVHSQLQVLQETVRLHNEKISRYITDVFLTKGIKDLRVVLKTEFKSEDHTDLVNGISFGEKK